MKEVRERIGKASHALGVLKVPRVQGQEFILHTKTLIMYKAVILVSLLHCSKTWTEA